MKFHSVQQGNPKWQHPIATPAPRNPPVVPSLPLAAQRSLFVVLVAPFVKRSPHAAAPLL
jgi:hypothetical protein